MAYGVRVHPVLPVFVVEGGARTAVYTPGHAAAVRREDLSLLRIALQEMDSPAPESLRRVARDLLDAARAAAAAWAARANGPWEPECLTVYLSNRCNLACGYCYAAAPRSHIIEEALPEPAILAAADLVAGYCRRKDKPFHLVVHGGGEPTVEWALLQRAVEISRNAARAAGVPWRGYIATNGTAPEDRLRWLAQHFDEIGLSCDGPPDIQERQRGARTAAHAATAARVFREQGTTFSVRATVTPASFQRMRDIVAWCTDALGAVRCRVEPVFGPRAGEPPFRPEDAPAFVAHYLEAAAEAGKRGCGLTFAGVRLDELHGPHCNVSKDVLQIGPDGAVSSCFLRGGAGGDHAGHCRLGAWDARTGELPVDERLAANRRAVEHTIAERCQDCLNQMHCAWGCPDYCPVEPGQWTASAEFRCRVSGLLAEAWIRDAVGIGQVSLRAGFQYYRV